MRKKRKKIIMSKLMKEKKVENKEDQQSPKLAI